MKTLTLIIMAVGVATGLSLQAADPQVNNKPTRQERQERRQQKQDQQAAAAKTDKPSAAEIKALRKEMLQKYDANSDKKLDQDEMAKVSAEDKLKLENAGLWAKLKNRAKKQAAR